VRAYVCAHRLPIRVYIHIANIYISLRVYVRIYIMSEFQVSAADTFLRRSRSRGNYFGSMADTRGPLYSTRFRRGIFILSCAQDAREQYRDRCTRESFYEKMWPFNSREFLWRPTVSFCRALYNVFLVNFGYFKIFCYDTIIMWIKNIFFNKNSIQQRLSDKIFHMFT